MKKDFLTEPKIASWMDELRRNGCCIEKITPLHHYSRPNGQLLFALVSADVTAPDGSKLPPIIFIRGHACLIVPLIINRDTDEKRYLMVQQRRIPTGALTLEFPAGMLDNNITQPLETAIKELHEETGLSLTPEQLFPLSPTRYYSSPGASDEGIYYYGCLVTVDNRTFHSFEGRNTGDATENECIHVTLKTKEDIILNINSLQARLGLFLFEEYCTAHGFNRETV